MNEKPILEVSLVPFGEDALRFDLPRTASIPHRRALFDALRSRGEVADVVIAETSGLIVLDHAPSPEDRSDLGSLIARVLESAELAANERPTTHVWRVVYDGEDLDEIAKAAKKTTAWVIAKHTEPDYRVAMLGFLPGFAYLRGLDPALELPRRSEPRKRVPAGSVAIAAEYTGVYPFASPGGWHLLGHAIDFDPLVVAETIALGDVVRFARAEASPKPARPPEPRRSLENERAPHLEVAAIRGYALPVDGGRPGHMHSGFPRGGPLVREAFERANALAGNACGACAIEVHGSIEVIARGDGLALAGDRQAERIRLRDGDHHVIEGPSRVHYLAIEGGFDAPVVLGSRCALLVANIGSIVKRGDPLFRAPAGAVGGPRVHHACASLSNDEIAITRGVDDVDGFVLESITGVDLRVDSASDRVGTRLTLPAEVLERIDPRGLRRSSAPMVMGAIELTPSGLIVLGPDHPTTGGYPVVAVVRDLDAFFSRRIGAVVRFSLT